MGKTYGSTNRKSIQSANIGVNPNNDGDGVKLFFSPIGHGAETRDWQRGKGMGEKGKVALWNF